MLFISGILIPGFRFTVPHPGKISHRRKCMKLFKQMVISLLLFQLAYL